MEKEEKIEALVEVVQNLQILYELTDEDMVEILNSIKQRKLVKNKTKK